MAIERRRFGVIRVLNLDKYVNPPKKRWRFGKPVLEPGREVKPQGRISRNFLKGLSFNRLKVLRLVIEQIYKQKYPKERYRDDRPEETRWSKLDDFFVLVRKGRQVLALHWIDVETAINSISRRSGKEIKAKKPKKGQPGKIQISE